jgi:two-component system nitrogen regulation response regulator GlnG
MAKILLIEPDTKVLEFISRFLMEAGHRVVISDQGKAALKKMEEDRYDLLICDTDLHDLPGLHMLKLIKENHEHLPVIVTASLDDPTGRNKAFGMGAFEYIVKPFDLELLLDAVQRAIWSSSSEKKENPVFSGLGGNGNCTK